MSMEPRSFLCAGRHLSAETATDVDLSTYFAQGGETPDTCPHCGHDMTVLKSTQPLTHRSNITCPSCGKLALQQRIACDYDLTPMIEAVPCNGQQYIVTCPRCGNAARVMRPLASLVHPDIVFTAGYARPNHKHTHTHTRTQAKERRAHRTPPARGGEWFLVRKK